MVMFRGAPLAASAGQWQTGRPPVPTDRRGRGDHDRTGWGDRLARLRAAAPSVAAWRVASHADRGRPLGPVAPPIPRDRFRLAW